MKPKTFEQFLIGKKFFNLETKQPAYFYSLPIKQKKLVEISYQNYLDEFEKEQVELKLIQKAKKAEQRKNA